MSDVAIFADEQCAKNGERQENPICPAQWPRFIEKFGRRGGRNNFMIENDGVAKLPDAEAKKSPNARV